MTIATLEPTIDRFSEAAWSISSAPPCGVAVAPVVAPDRLDAAHAADLRRAIAATRSVAELAELLRADPALWRPLRNRVEELRRLAVWTCYADRVAVLRGTIAAPVDVLRQCRESSVRGARAAIASRRHQIAALAGDSARKPPTPTDPPSAATTPEGSDPSGSQRAA